MTIDITSSYIKSLLMQSRYRGEPLGVDFTGDELGQQERQKIGYECDKFMSFITTILSSEGLVLDDILNKHCGGDAHLLGDAFAEIRAYSARREPVPCWEGFSQGRFNLKEHKDVIERLADVAAAFGGAKFRYVNDITLGYSSLFGKSRLKRAEELVGGLTMVSGDKSEAPVA